MDKPIFYSRKILNPFQGMVQTVEQGHGRAISFDGVNWQLQVLDWDDEQLDISERFQNYGVWSRSEGLTRLPISPLLDFERVNSQTQTLLGTLSKQLPSLPFPERDVYELWLWDEQQQSPLVLLQSSVSTVNQHGQSPITWQPENRNAVEFNTQTLFSMPDIARCNGDYVLYLKHHLSARCHQGRCRVWCQKLEDQNRKIIATSHASLRPGEILPATLFPALLLTQQWQDDELTQLVESYINWHAPYFLCLPDLPVVTRAQLEKKAVKQDLLLYKLHKLIPTYCNKELIQAVLVKAVLRKNVQL